jgi:hypothetical protein|tara:strand:+ start:2957 stop:3424 length:468 start_codon:yes stop_codon:yes gene_type:complete
MQTETYIVEGSNWKCKVDVEKTKDSTNKEYRLIEAATLCIEHIFGNYEHMDCVDMFELKDRQGVDYFKCLDSDEIPDPSFGILTKVYKLKDLKNVSNHYVIRTRMLLENASANHITDLLDDLEDEIKSTNPKMLTTINQLMEGKSIFKFGDLPHQ